ncbi:MAG: Nif3-like dinuclear metal center hexameric protein [Calditrichaeota bacterium]|nr:MAG: Nif3-like dinuclear metal center hexameric protein [Calditrichota bacterium]
MTIDDLHVRLNALLNIEAFKDLCPNGLQVRGRTEVSHVVTGVSACVELFEKALELGADTVMTHHGIIWNFERPVYDGGYKKRVKLLLENDINLLAYHLPLDAHDSLGNNALLAKELHLKQVTPFGNYNGMSIGFSGQWDGPSDKLFAQIRQSVNPDSMIFPFGPSTVRRVGIISGAAQKEVKQAVLQGLDAFITGEVSEHIYHYAREEGIHFIAAGHHATEVFGIRALGEFVNREYGIQTTFVNIPNPV